jgi:hypothetical protein
MAIFVDLYRDLNNNIFHFENEINKFFLRQAPSVKDAAKSLLLQREI